MSFSFIQVQIAADAVLTACMLPCFRIVTSCVYGSLLPFSLCQIHWTWLYCCIIWQKAVSAVEEWSWWCVAGCMIANILNSLLAFILDCLTLKLKAKESLKMSLSAAPLTQHHNSETHVLSKSCQNVTTHSCCSWHCAVTNVRYILRPVEFLQINDCFVFNNRIIQWST